jgi:hypothetical protein
VPHGDLDHPITRSSDRPIISTPLPAPVRIRNFLSLLANVEPVDDVLQAIVAGIVVLDDVAELLPISR